MVALEEEDMKVAEHYLELARRNGGVPGVRLVDRDELLKLEPNVNPNAAGALWAPHRRDDVLSGCGGGPHGERGRQRGG